MVIFHGCVKLPEGILSGNRGTPYPPPVHPLNSAPVPSTELTAVSTVSARSTSVTSAGLLPRQNWNQEAYHSASFGMLCDSPMEQEKQCTSRKQESARTEFYHPKTTKKMAWPVLHTLQKNLSCSIDTPIPLIPND